MFALPAGQVHVWWAEVVTDPDRLAAEHDLLDEEERLRAAHFVVEPPRRSFITAHAMIRRLVQHYTGVGAGDLGFLRSQRGKPCLAAPELSWLRFNLSHSGDVVVAALARDVDLGVDVEVLRTMDAALRLARRFFSAAEAQQLATLPEQQRSKAFLRSWTCKEAYLKAVGTGIGEGLAEVEVEVSASAPQRFVRLGGCAESAAEWSLHQLEPRPGTIVTVALPGHCWQVTIRRTEG